jgi:hypothetical protein
MLDVRHQGHKSSSFDGSSEVSLTFGSHTSALSTHHSGVWVHIGFQAQDVFVVDMVLWSVNGSFF